MTRYEILANDLSNMLHEQLRVCKNRVNLYLVDYFEYVIKCNFVSIIDYMLENEQLDEDEIITLMNKSLNDLYNFYYKGFDEDVNKVYCDCIVDFCLEAKEN